MPFSSSCALSEDCTVPAPSQRARARSVAVAPASAAAARATPADPARRERRLLLTLVALAHIAGPILLSQPDARTEPRVDTPISVALIEMAVAEPEAPAAPPQAPAAPPAPPEPVAPPEPPPPAPPEPVTPPPEPPPPQPAPELPKPAPPPPKKPAAAPKPVTKAPTAIKREEAPPVVREPAPAPPSPPAPARAPTPAPVAAQPAAAPTKSAASRPSTAPATVTAARFDAAYLNNPPPAYPTLSRRMREQGRVLLRVFVTAEGQPGRIELSESSGSSRLDKAAEAAVARWRFVPARQGERDVDAWVIVPIVFKLEG
ncbi:MAG TPA: energy transducer TonB [Rhodocyclaceae bacterium]|nr:energy transducer TonB [Rhodocyclaceae bacterium]